MCAYDLESPAVYIETEPVARKRHRCCECGWEILPGTRYNQIRGLWDGCWQTYRAHRDCRTVYGKLGREFCDGQYAIGDLRGFLAEHLAEFRGWNDADALRIVLWWRRLLRARRREGSGPWRRAA